MLGAFKKNRKFLLAALVNEDGSAIVIALITLVALTIIGIASSNISIIELFVSGNDVVKKISFFNADSGVYTVPKIISKSIDDRETPTTFTPPFSFIDAGASDTTTGERTFYRELSGLEDYDAAFDVTFQNDGENDTNVDVERLGSFTLVGGGAEFASGAEGHGTGLRGIRYAVNAAGQGPKDSVTNIQVRYLKVLGTAGGL